MDPTPEEGSQGKPASRPAPPSREALGAETMKNFGGGAEEQTFAAGLSRTRRARTRQQPVPRQEERDSNTPGEPSSPSPQQERQSATLQQFEDAGGTDFSSLRRRKRTAPVPAGAPQIEQRPRATGARSERKPAPSRAESPAIEALLDKAKAQQRKFAEARDLYFAAIDAHAKKEELSKARREYLYARGILRNALEDAFNKTTDDPEKREEFLVLLYEKYTEGEQKKIRDHEKKAAAALAKGVSPTPAQGDRGPVPPPIPPASPIRGPDANIRPARPETRPEPQPKEAPRDIPEPSETPEEYLVTLKQEYEGARTEYILEARASNPSGGTVERLRKGYLDAAKAYALALAAKTDSEHPIGKDGTRGVEYEKKLDALVDSVYGRDNRDDRVGEHMDLVREIARDKELFDRFGARISERNNETPPKPSYAFLRTLLDSPVRKRVTGEIGAVLDEDLWEGFKTARFEYLNAYYDFLTNYTLGNELALEKAERRYDAARNRIIREEKRGPEEEAGEGIGRKRKLEIWRELFAEEKKGAETLERLLLSPRKQESLAKSERFGKKLRWALISIFGLAGASMVLMDENAPQTYRTEETGTPARPRAEPPARTESREQQAPRPEAQVEAPAPQAEAPAPVPAEVAPERAPSVNVAEVSVSSRGAIETFDALLGQHPQPWFSDWAQSLYDNHPNLDTVDPGGIRSTPEGQRKVMADLIAQELRMSYRSFSGGTEYSARLPEGTVYVNSGGVFLAPQDGTPHIALVRNGASVEPLVWEGRVDEYRRK